MALHVSKRRVVVTGMGLVTCLGVGVQHVWNKLIQGHCGIGCLNATEYQGIPCQVAGHVPVGTDPGLFNSSSHFSKSDQRTLPRATLYALVAAQEALKQAAWFPTCPQDQRRTGVAVGAGMVDLTEITTAGSHLASNNYRKITPLFIPKILINMAAGHISLKYGLRGPNHAVSTACATGLHAVGDAARFIQFDDADVMVCGGTEASVTPLGIAGFARMRALATDFNDSPLESSRPFDKRRCGFVMSEGSAILVLEELGHAQRRGVNILGEVLGYGLSGDASHITSPSETGDGAYDCMMSALRHAMVLPSGVGYVNAHATSTPLGDAAESQAIHRLFHPHPTLAVSSTKGATGHLLGAAGAVEAVFSLQACVTGTLPPTINLEETDIPLGLNYVPLTAQAWGQVGRRVALTNSFGFGGTNVSVCVANFV